jgi:hypothetical protein
MFHVKAGDSLNDAFPKPPYSLFSDYGRICVDPKNADRRGMDAGDEVDVYLHRWSDISAGGRPALDLSAD